MILGWQLNRPSLGEHFLLLSVVEGAAIMKVVGQGKNYKTSTERESRIWALVCQQIDLQSI